MRSLSMTRYWDASYSCVGWITRLRDLVVEHPKAPWDDLLSNMQAPLLHEIERQMQTWQHELRYLLDWRMLDLKRLIERGKDRGEVAKARIDLYAHVTSRGNLTFNWRPTNDTGAPADQDFSGWQAYWGCDDQADIMQRPHNEFVFLRDIESLDLSPERHRALPHGDLTLQRDRFMAFAIRALFNDIGHFLLQFFEVRLVNTLDFTFDAEGKAIDWKIEYTDVIWARDFDDNRYGVTLKQFAALCHDRAHHSTIAKQLRNAGHLNVTGRETRVWQDEFEYFSTWPDFRSRFPELFRVTRDAAPVVAIGSRR